MFRRETVKSRLAIPSTPEQSSVLDGVVQFNIRGPTAPTSGRWTCSALIVQPVRFDHFNGAVRKRSHGLSV